MLLLCCLQFLFLSSFPILHLLNIWWSYAYESTQEGLPEPKGKHQHSPRKICIVLNASHFIALHHHSVSTTLPRSLRPSNNSLYFQRRFFVSGRNMVRREQCLGGFYAHNPSRSWCFEVQSVTCCSISVLLRVFQFPVYWIVIAAHRCKMYFAGWFLGHSPFKQWPFSPWSLLI